MKTLKYKLTMALVAVGMSAALILTGCSGTNQVVLIAKPHNNGFVYLWEAVREGPDVSYVALSNGTRCTQLDGVYKLDGDTSFVKLNCNGRIGYVHSDQAR